MNLPSWSEIPMLRMAIPFILGIIISTLAENLIFWAISSCIFLILGFWLAYKHRPRFKFRYWFGVPLIFMWFILGGFSVQLATDFLHKNYYGDFENAEEFGVRVLQSSYRKGDFSEILGAVESVRTEDGEWISTHGKAFIRFKDTTLQVYRNSKMVMVAKVSIVDGRNAPGIFDFQKHMAEKHIWHQIHVSAGNFKIVDSVKSDFLVSLREFCMKIIEHQYSNEKARGVISALLLGQKRTLDKEVQQAFANTGTIHVLAVSGLHVGMVYLLLSFLLRGFSNSKNARILRFLIEMTAIWIFAALSGMSPSVNRACLMFSILGIGKILNRPVHLYNTLATSALILCAIDPYMLFNLGFQLSYFAVFGIAFWQSNLVSLIKFQFKGFQYLWQMATVSTSAQLGTLPIGLLIFHRFPIWFLPANLIILPFIPFIMGIGALALVLSFLPVIGSIIAQFNEYFILVLIKVVSIFDSFPGSALGEFSINSVQCISLYLLLIGIGLGFFEKLKSAGTIGLLAVIVFGANYAIQQNQIKGTNGLWLYQSYKGGEIAFQSDGCLLNFFINSTIPLNHSKSNNLAIRNLGLSDSLPIALPSTFGNVCINPDEMIVSKITEKDSVGLVIYNQPNWFMLGKLEGARFIILPGKDRSNKTIEKLRSMQIPLFFIGSSSFFLPNSKNGIPIHYSRGSRQGLLHYIKST